MRRRDFIKVVGGVAVTWPVAARAQQGERMRRIGVLIGVEDDVEGQARLAAFRKGMLDSGWSEGRDLQMDVRFTAGNADRARIYAAELIKSAPDVILANTSTVVTVLKGTDNNNTHCVCASCRPGQQRLCGQPCAPRWQHNWIC